MQINFTYDPGTSLEQILVFETAAKVWESYLQDDVTVNLQVGVTQSSNLPDGVIGGALPGMQANTAYQAFRESHAQDVTSADDAIAADNLDFGNSFWLRHELQLGNTTAGISGMDYVDTVNLTTANAKALDLASSDSPALDGYILMSDLDGYAVEWDYDVTRNAPADSGKLDFLSTALHEIGHALGFVSGVDQPGWVAAVVDKAEDLFSVARSSDVRSDYVNALDLFRYSDRSNGDIDIGYGSELGEKYFSIDGGNTALANFSSGSDTGAGGDGYQASHWERQSNALGIMDPTLGLGERSQISALDLQALDVIGWDTKSQDANATLNLSQLRTEALQSIADRLGQSVSWVGSQPDKAAERLSEVRVVDIARMADQSEVYDLSWLNPSGGDSFWLNWGNPSAGQGYWLNWWNQGGGQGWWQTMEQLFQQRGLFSRFEEFPVAELPQEAVDAITGQPAQQPVGAMPNAGLETQTPSAPAELFSINSVDAFGDLLDGQGYDSLGNGIRRGGSGFALGGESSGGLLSQGLAGLGQDQLQGQGGLMLAGLGESL